MSKRLFAGCFCALLSMYVYAHVHKVLNPGDLSHELQQGRIVKGHINLHRCTADDGLAPPTFLGSIAIDFSRHMLDQNRCTRTSEEYGTLVAHEKASQETPVTEIIASRVFYTVISCEGKPVKVTIHYYDLNNQLLLDKKFSCSWRSWGAQMQLLSYPSS
ncbi:hypothetical protein [Spongorhabdus nitratireducens]